MLVSHMGSRHPSSQPSPVASWSVQISGKLELGAELGPGTRVWEAGSVPRAIARACHIPELLGHVSLLTESPGLLSVCSELLHLGVEFTGEGRGNTKQFTERDR